MPFIDLRSQYLAFQDSIDARMARVLEHGQYIMGPEVEELEQTLAEFVGVSHCITTASGTEALLMSLMAAEVKAGDEIITTPFSFVSTVEVIARLGAVPVFVDVEKDTANIDASKIEQAVTERTRAILPVSLYGQIPDMDPINALAKAHGSLYVIEDAAQSFGATYHGRKSCGLSNIGCTSFFPSKPLGCYGDGGAAFINDDGLAERLRRIRVHGQEARHLHTLIGVGGRMDTLQCAAVLGKWGGFAAELDKRTAVAQRYADALACCEGLQLPVIKPGRQSAWAQFTIQIENREQWIQALKERHIPTAVHYPRPLHRQPAYESLCRVSGSLDNAERLAETVLSLPMHPYLDNDTQNWIIGALASTRHPRELNGAPEAPLAQCLRNNAPPT
ncbi:MAG: DegT/DnrJ/EryC1/StrS family aminotransferase [Candidatus Eutrophobiaceae bacterium]